MDVESKLLEFLSSRQWPMVAALVIWVIVRALKSERIPIDVPARWRPWLALGLGIAAGASESFIAGAPLLEALIGGLGAAGGAIAIQEALVESARHGREPLSVPPPAYVEQPRESRRPPPSAPLPPGSTMMLLAGALLCLGCSSPLNGAIVVANAARDAGEVAREELQVRCVEGYKSATSTADVARLDGVCLPLRDAYRGLRGAHLALVTAIQVAQARGDISVLPAAMAATVEASELVATAVQGGAR